MNKMNRLKEVLAKYGNLKQKDLATAMGVSKYSVSQWATNQKQPSLSRIHDISKWVGCDASELVDNDYEPT